MWFFFARYGYRFLGIAEFRSPGANPRAGWCCYFLTPCAADMRRLSGNGVTHSRVGALIWSAIAVAPDSLRIKPNCKLLTVTNSAYHFFWIVFQTCRRASSPFQFCNGPNLSTSVTVLQPPRAPLSSMWEDSERGGLACLPVKGKPPTDKSLYKAMPWEPKKSLCHFSWHSYLSNPDI